MKPIKIFDKSKKKKFIERVSYLGIERVPYLLIQTGKERIRGFSGSLSLEEISKLRVLLPVEVIGLYLAKELENKDMRLSVDALHIMKNQITKNIVNISKEQEKEWFFGKNIELTPEQQEKYASIKGFVAVESEGDFLGTGKLSDDKKVMINFLPKERRVKN